MARTRGKTGASSVARRVDAGGSESEGGEGRGGGERRLRARGICAQLRFGLCTERFAVVSSLFCTFSRVSLSFPSPPHHPPPCDCACVPCVCMRTIAVCSGRNGKKREGRGALLEVRPGRANNPGESEQGSWKEVDIERGCRGRRRFPAWKQPRSRRRRGSEAATGSGVREGIARLMTHFRAVRCAKLFLSEAAPRRFGARVLPHDPEEQFL